MKNILKNSINVFSYFCSCWRFWPTPLLISSETTFFDAPFFHFVLNIFGAFLSGVNAPKTIYKHENGFNTSMECPTLPAVEYEFEKRCCGVYPKTISPYRHSGNRECCGGLRTYNPNLYQCCDSEENEEVRVSVVCWYVKRRADVCVKSAIPWQNN